MYKADQEPCTDDTDHRYLLQQDFMSMFMFYCTVCTGMRRFILIKFEEDDVKDSGCTFTCCISTVT